MNNIFKNKNYALLFQGTLTSHIASSLYTFAISFYILQLTNNNAVIQGAYLAICGIVTVISLIFGGVIADRFNLAKLIYSIDYIKGFIILLSSIPIYFLLNVSNEYVLIVLFLLGIINSSLGGIFNPASQAIIPEICEEKELKEANSYLQSLNSFVNILGVVLAGVLYAMVDLIILFIIIGVCFTLSGFSEMFIKTSYKRNNEKLTIKQVKDDFIGAFKYLYPKKAIITFMCGVLIINFFLSPVMSNAFPYIVKTTIASSNYLFKDKINPELIQSLFTICFSVGSILTGIILANSKKKINVSLQIKFFLTFMGILMVFLALNYFVFANRNINVFILLTCFINIFIGTSIIGVNVPMSYTMQTKIDKSMLAKVLSLMNIGSQGLIPFATLLGGIIIDKLGVQTLLVFCAIGFLLTALVIDFNKTIKNL